MTDFTHLDHDGNITMVDVGDKIATKRSATATGKVFFPPEVYAAIKVVDGQTKKGNILTIAHIAGIMAGKKTHELIPLCHALPLDTIKMSFAFQDDVHAITVTAITKVEHKTGVEMEALTAVSVACLTIYDMSKALSHEIVIGDICLVNKTGGKSDYAK